MTHAHKSNMRGNSSNMYQEQVEHGVDVVQPPALSVKGRALQLFRRDSLPFRKIDIDEIPHVPGVKSALVLARQLFEESEEVM